MTTTCEQYRELLLEYVQGDLQSLEHTRMESHLSNCRQCSELSSALRLSMESVRAWKPEVDPEHLERLIHRLSPFMAEQRPRALLQWGGLAFAGALAAALILFFETKPPELGEAPVVVAVEEAQPNPAPEAPREVIRTARENLRVVASKDWDGRIVQRNGGKLGVEMSRGFAVLAFHKVDGQELWIEAPGVEVVASGTVFVELSEPKLATVGVVSGRAEVRTPKGVEELSEGKQKSFVEDGTVAEPRAHPLVDELLRDPFLREATENGALVSPPAEQVSQLAEPNPVPERIEPTAPRPKSPARRAKNRRPRSVRSLSPDVLERIVEAENLARSGRIDSAIAEYRAILRDPAYRQFRNYLEYEIARLIAFEKGDREAARREFERLSAGRDREVRTQAAFALCELDLQPNPCRAKLCLEKMSGHRTEGVRKEARALLQRWALEGLECPGQRGGE